MAGKVQDFFRSLLAVELTKLKILLIIICGDRCKARNRVTALGEVFVG
jgi:hypothetical protein